MSSNPQLWGKALPALDSNAIYLSLNILFSGLLNAKHLISTFANCNQSFIVFVNKHPSVVSVWMAFTGTLNLPIIHHYYYIILYFVVLIINYHFHRSITIIITCGWASGPLSPLSRHRLVQTRMALKLPYCHSLKEQCGDSSPRG